jgi:hypothetical protein
LWNLGLVLRCSISISLAGRSRRSSRGEQIVEQCAEMDHRLTQPRIDVGAAER